MTNFKLIKERIDSTDTFTLEAAGDDIVLAPVWSKTKKDVSSFKHGWLEKQGYKLIAAINATYFSAYGVVGGMYVDSGFEMSAFLPDKKFITLILSEGKLILDEEYDIDELKAKYPKMNFAIQTGDPLVKDGERYAGDGEFDHTYNRNPRTFIGQKKTGEIVFFVTDGRTGSDRGFTSEEAARIAMDMDLETATLLDGGGSSTMDIEGEMVNQNEDREVFSVFTLYAKEYEIEETTIEVDPSIFEQTDSVPEALTYISWADWLKQKLTPNFTRKELACNDNDEFYIDQAAYNHAWRLEEVRKRMAAELGYVLALIVNSWFRTVIYNTKVGGSSTSLHLAALATDIKIGKGWIQDLFKQKWYEVCEDDGIEGGCGRYNTFIHVDSRRYRGEWDERS